ncbi:MAG: hypothetical protein ACI4PM_07280 [Butyricicoccus sp.]
MKCFKPLTMLLAGILLVGTLSGCGETESDSNTYAEDSTSYTDTSSDIQANMDIEDKYIVFSSTEYDKYGTAQVETYYTYDENGNLINISDSDSYNYSYEYDEENRLIYATSNEMHIFTGLSHAYGPGSFDAEIVPYTFYDYGGLNTYEYGEDGKLSKAYHYSSGELQYYYFYTYDSQGNLTILKTKYADGSADEDSVTLECEYNADHQLIKTLYYKGDFTSSYEYVYDNHGNLIQKLDDDGDTENYEYNDNDQMIKFTGENGYPIYEYEYDSNGNKIKRIYKSAEENGHAPYIEYEYILLSDYLESYYYS